MREIWFGLSLMVVVYLSGCASSEGKT